jgi:hypothetical protein
VDTVPVWRRSGGNIEWKKRRSLQDVILLGAALWSLGEALQGIERKRESSAADALVLGRRIFGDFVPRGAKGGRVDYDLMVIGAGTAGTWAARTAAGLGARTALVEQDGFAGTCLATG